MTSVTDFVDWAEYVTQATNARRYVRAAASGNIPAMAALFQNLPRAQRPAFARAMFQARMHRNAFRYFLKWAWGIDGQAYMLERIALLDVIAMFRYAKFDLPDHIGAVVRAYRGTFNISPDQAAQGLSWSLDKSVACRFAYGFGRPDAVSPLVIEADIPREQILMYIGTPELNEILVEPISRNSSIKYAVSGTPEEWRE